jgi:hypothetical protein
MFSVNRFSKVFFVIAISFLLANCQSATAPTQPTAEVPTDSITLITTGTTLEPGFLEMDSIAVLFYHDPFGKDAERYTRYYKTFTSNADSIIGLLQANMAQPFTEDSLRNCRSEGKMYCFSKGKVIQTVYFNTKQEGCYQLYFINTARYYYFKPMPALVAQLAKIKTKAKE